MFFVFKLILFFFVFKLVWIIAGIVVFTVFWGSVLGLIVFRSLRDKLNPGSTSFRLPPPR